MSLARTPAPPAQSELHPRPDSELGETSTQSFGASREPHAAGNTALGKDTTGNDASRSYERAWRVAALRTSLVIAVALAVGLISGRLLEVWAALTSVYLMLQVYQLWRLDRWLRVERRLAPPQSFGIWSAVFQRMAESRQRGRDRKRRLTQLLRAFRQATAAMPDGIVAIDDDDRILWCNRQAQRLLGLHPAQDLGSRVGNLLRHPQFLAWMERGPIDQPLHDVPAPQNDALRLGFRMLEYAGGQRLLIARDITPMMRLEQVRRDFVANVSHELRTPLTVINGYLDEIEPEELPEWADVMTALKHQSRRTMRIVEDLLTLSRLDATSEPAALNPVALTELLEGLVEDARRISQGQHQIGLQCAPGVELLGSPGDLRVCFSNLLTNAIRYTPPGGRIEVRWSSGSGTGTLEVRDTGVGIPGHHLPRITERFYRVSPDRSRGSGGTGLGLAIVKHVLGLHDAILEVESEAGKGSCFRCRFPSHRVRQPSPVAAQGIPS